jgi:adenylate kinase family enzyme
MASERVLILGVPRAGKTTLAARMCPTGVSPRSTDALIREGWHTASDQAALWLDAPGPWVIEGVAAVRALRKWFRLNPHKRPPFERVIWLGSPRLPLSERQGALALGTASIFGEVLPRLERWRVRVERR